MSPDKRSGRGRASRSKNTPPPVMVRPSSDDVHEVVFFKRHINDDPTEAIPGRDALRSYPVNVRALMRRVAAEVAAAPPKRFAGGGLWEAMHGDLSGYFEIRAIGPGRRHYRLFCLLDYAAGPNYPKPLLVILAGLSKPNATLLTPAQYVGVKNLGKEYLSRNPRSIA